MPTVSASSDQVIALRVGPIAYRTLVEERGDSSASRLAYDGEVLEIMAPSFGHDIYSRLIDRLVGAYAQERDLPFLSAGSTTLRVEPGGAEPDASYYLKNAFAVVGKTTIDLAVDAPPDIVVEVDLSRSRIDKAAIYGALRIPEFWRYDGILLSAFARDVGGAYHAIAFSRELPGLPIAELHRFMELRNSLDQTAIAKAWLAQIRSGAFAQPERTDAAD